MNKHSDCADRCQLREHKGYLDCTHTGICAMLDAVVKEEGLKLVSITDGTSTHTRTVDEWLALARADIRSLPDGWKPIETAPRDGRKIILGGEGYAEEGYWMNDPKQSHWGETGWYFTDDDVLCGHPCKPTHWQAHPAAPEKT